MQAHDLLAKAAALYDAPQFPFAAIAEREGWSTDFNFGAEWMRIVMVYHRQRSIEPRHAPYNLLGILKYGIACLGVLIYLLLIGWTGIWTLVPGFVLVFYAIEAQMVFLFPLVIDGSSIRFDSSEDNYLNSPVLSIIPTEYRADHPLIQAFRESRLWTQRAGGTARVMRIVMQLAVVMLCGGFVGKGFVRSWALGCLAVVLWYEELRHAEYFIPK
ncbi:MAG: hypothetical protein AAF702_45055 [Chloroflexota bacterium]